MSFKATPISFYSRLHETTRLLVECSESKDSSESVASTLFSLENEPLVLVEIDFSTNIFYTQYIIIPTGYI